MTAKISEDCKNESRRKIKQVISVERARRRDGDERRRYLQMLLFFVFMLFFFPLHKSQLWVTHVQIEDTLWGLCNNLSVRCVAAMHSEKWWLYVNCARVRYVCVCVWSCHRLVYQADAAVSLLYIYSQSCRCRAAAFDVCFSSFLCFSYIFPLPTAYLCLSLLDSFSCLSLPLVFFSILKWV